jgi:predicted AAA+ superfamily ATPase
MTLNYVSRLLKLPKKHSFFLFGPRQTGKSTLLAESFSHETTVFINLLDSEEYYKYSVDIAAFKREADVLDKKITHIVIDEIQRIPELLNYVHLLMEENKNRFFILTGSSARKLKRGQANLLGGRAWNLSLFPLLQSELKEKFDLDRALQIGTLPQIYLSEDLKSAHRSLAAYCDIYIHEEIKAESLVRNIGAFMMFLKFAANENGSVISFANISKEINVSSVTVKEYFSILEDTLLGFFLYPYSSSVRKQLVKHPKFYFFDTGVVRQLNGKLKANLQRGTKDYGDIFEHFIIKEIIHKSKYLENDYKFSFYRTNAGAEVDLIIKKPCGEILAIEIKSSNNPSLKDLKGLFSFKELEPEARLICLSQVTRKQVLETKSGTEVEVLPWAEFFNSM